jgi:hypothetical protein
MSQLSATMSVVPERNIAHKLSTLNLSSPS